MKDLPYSSIKDKQCERGCGKRIIWVGKLEGKKGDTGWCEWGTTITHTFKRCDRLIAIAAEKAKHGSLFG